LKKRSRDPATQAAYKIVREAGYVKALTNVKAKGMASLEPTFTEVGNTNVADDSAEAVRLLKEMAEKQHRTFEQVFSDPENKALAGRTYTSAHRPNSSSTSGDELQRQ
jgi:Ser-tRNA(Ala) deacylase AlaX